MPCKLLMSTTFISAYWVYCQNNGGNVYDVQTMYTFFFPDARAHTDEDTPEAKINCDTDFYLSLSHEIKHLIPQSPILTFHMNDYTFY